MSNTVRTRKQMLEYKKSILNYINSNPNATVEEILPVVGGPNGTLNWHLRIMANRGMITREKGDGGVLRHRILPGALGKVKKEYTTPIIRNTPKTYKKTSQTQSSTKEVVDVSAPTINITLNGQEQQVSLKGAKDLYFKLKNIFEE